MLLDRFREAKAEEIALLMDMASRRELPRPWKGRRPDFLKAIAEPPDGQPVAVIAEFKQSSPSRGVIASGLKPEEVAEQYAASGASCISVLTEEQFSAAASAIWNAWAAPGFRSSARISFFISFR